MLFDMETLEAQNRYKILTATVTPRPIAWVTTLSAGMAVAGRCGRGGSDGHRPAAPPGGRDLKGPA